MSFWVDSHNPSKILNTNQLAWEFLNVLRCVEYSIPIEFANIVNREKNGGIFNGWSYI